jgi:hypothetical protein
MTPRNKVYGLLILVKIDFMTHPGHAVKRRAAGRAGDRADDESARDRNAPAPLIRG